jgi:hypothetical protein
LEYDASDEEVEKEIDLYPRTFSSGFNILSRFVFFHIFSYMRFVRRNVLEKGEKIKLHHLPKLSEEENLRNRYPEALKSFNHVSSTAGKVTTGFLVKLIFF